MTSNMMRPIKCTSVHLCITCSTLFLGASAGQIVKAKLMPTLPWYAIKSIVSGIFYFILTTLGFVNLLIYSAYM